MRVRNRFADAAQHGNGPRCLIELHYQVGWKVYRPGEWVRHKGPVSFNGRDQPPHRAVFEFHKHMQHALQTMSK